MVSQAEKIEKLTEAHDSLDQRLDRVEMKQDLHESNDKARHELAQASVGEVKRAVEALDSKMFKLVMLLVAALAGTKAVEMGMSPVASAHADAAPEKDSDE